MKRIYLTLLVSTRGNLATLNVNQFTEGRATFLSIRSLIHQDDIATLKQTQSTMTVVTQAGGGRGGHY